MIKRQITTVLAGFLAGDFLPPQLIYKGTTPRCLPMTEFPKEWDVTYNAKHWSNEITMLQHIDKILLPYICKKKEDLKLPSNYPVLIISLLKRLILY